MNIDMIVSLFYFFLFVIMCVWLIRRLLPALQKADEDERKNYKQLVAHRAGLKKELDLEHEATVTQGFMQEHLTDVIKRWNLAMQQKKEKNDQEQKDIHSAVLKKNEQRMFALANQQIKKTIMPEIFKQSRQKLEKQFQMEKLSNAYIADALQTLKSE